MTAVSQGKIVLFTGEALKWLESLKNFLCKSTPDTLFFSSVEEGDSFR
jgi:hypothetical protein